MATTDARPGFRLPWSADRAEAGEEADVHNQDAPSQESVGDQESETPAMIDAAHASTDPVAAVDPEVADPSTAEATAEPAHTPEPDPQPESDVAASAGGKKPSKFLADLTKAMQAAAESARGETLSRFTAEAKQHIETIHADSANEATELRKRADDDVAAIREWSKAEIARIRDETDQKINRRKADLEEEVDEHAAAIERRIERVQARVAAFEAEMDGFFEKLLAEEDPTRFAAMAESLPEPPPFDGDEPAAIAAVVEPGVQESEAPEAVAETVDGEAAATDEPTMSVEAEGEPAAEGEGEPTVEGSAEATAEQPVEQPVEQPADSGDLFGIADATPAVGEADPRLAAIGADADFAAAEAEAAAFTPDAAPEVEEIPTIGDDALAARLAHLVPDADAAPADVTTTRVVVVGLVSVASIAGFKRHLSRVAGVQSVGVSSGPDGEFVFAVAHGPEVVLRDAVALLPGFGARVTGETDGGLTVTAHDPETEG